MTSYLDFEKEIAEIDGQIREIELARSEASEDEKEDSQESASEQTLEKLRERRMFSLKELYATLTPWQKTLVARHPGRPHSRDYIHHLIDDFTPLAGDRSFGEDHALLAGFGRLAFGQMKGYSVAILGHEKGCDTQTRLKHNFGMASPEGYRKAVRIMEMADRFGIPLLSFVDTAGAYPGLGAEERGQAESIARATDACLSLSVPFVATIIGEGGSGGAIAIATANEVLMLEHAIYSVISPEGAASILWHDASHAQDAAQNMKITAQDLMTLEVIDTIIPEPVGGAHRGKPEILTKVGAEIDRSLKPYLDMSPEDMRTHRMEKFMNIGREL